MSKREINVLLLGETGVGKSTFINVLANYLTYDTLNEAASKNLMYLVPSKFTYLDDDLEEHEITIGSSDNEVTTVGESSTQNPKSYRFNLKEQNAILRVIDTPGIGDTRGMNYDQWNTEKLLSFISELEYLNAICIVLKPNNSRFNVLFEYCMKQILLRLDRKIKNNIIFLFTNARSTFYKPGDTYVPLKMMLKQVEMGPLQVRIPLTNENMFCVDNECFKYLAANSTGVKFSKEVIQEYNNSWDKSSTAVKQMIRYWASLNPVTMQGIVSINESRRIIVRLVQPVIDLMVYYQKALVRLEEHEEDLQESKDNIAELKPKLYTPKMENYIQEKIIITDTSTAHGFNFGIGITAVPPYVTNLDLGYNYYDKNDRHVEEKIASREKIVRDPEIDAMINNEQNISKALKREIENLKTLSQEYQNEAKMVLGVVAKFITFLKENAMISNQDPFENQLALIVKEETTGGGNHRFTQALQNMLNRYKVKKEGTFDVRPEDIRDAMYDLINLKNTGVIFKQIMAKKYNFNDQEPIAQ